MKLYQIIADYRPNNPHKPKYYVIANSKSDAKKKFKDLLSWLDIYGICEVDDKESKKIIGEPMKHIIIE